MVYDRSTKSERENETNVQCHRICVLCTFIIDNSVAAWASGWSEKKRKTYHKNKNTNRTMQSNFALKTLTTRKYTSWCKWQSDLLAWISYDKKKIPYPRDILLLQLLLWLLLLLHVLSNASPNLTGKYTHTHSRWNSKFHARVPYCQRE